MTPDTAPAAPAAPGPAGIRDHGGGIDAAARRWGGARANWIDLSRLPAAATTRRNPAPR